jgi:hypothetical protein
VSQRDNENALQVQDSLEREVTGGASSFSTLRTVLSFFAVAYDLMRRVSHDDIQFLGKTENGKVLLRFAQTIQKMIGDDGLYLWRDVEGLSDGKAGSDKLTLADLSEAVREALLDQAKDLVAESIKQEVIDEAVSEVRDSAVDTMRDACDSWASDLEDKKSCVSGQLEDALSHLRDIDVSEVLDALNGFDDAVSEVRSAIECAQNDVDNYDAYDGASDAVSNAECEF